MKHLLYIALLSQLLMAAPAFQGKRTFTQPNGETITYRMHGDEYLHWFESENGDIMLYNKKNKRIESAVIKDGLLKASGHAFSPANRSAAQNTQAITREMLLELQQQRRKTHFSKIHRIPKEDQ